MFPNEVKGKLIQNQKFLWEESYNSKKNTFIVTDEDVAWFRSELKIKDPLSSFISFYAVVAIPPVGNGPELLTLEQIIEYESVEEEPDELGSIYLRISSQEGGGGLVYCVETYAVYDVDWGQESDMINGIVGSKYQSFRDFLAYYYG